MTTMRMSSEKTVGSKQKAVSRRIEEHGRCLLPFAFCLLTAFWLGIPAYFAARSSPADLRF